MLLAAEDSYKKFCSNASPIFFFTFSGIPCIIIYLAVEGVGHPDIGGRRGFVVPELLSILNNMIFYIKTLKRRVKTLIICHKQHAFSGKIM